MVKLNVINRKDLFIKFGITFEALPVTGRGGL
jgi:hypothetical protein